MQENAAQDTAVANRQWQRIAFQSVALVSLAIMFGERSWRLLRDVNRQFQYHGRG